MEEEKNKEKYLVSFYTSVINGDSPKRIVHEVETKEIKGLEELRAVSRRHNLNRITVCSELYERYGKDSSGYYLSDGGQNALEGVPPCCGESFMEVKEKDGHKVFLSELMDIYRKILYKQEEVKNGDKFCIDIFKIRERENGKEFIPVRQNMQVDGLDNLKRINREIKCLNVERNGDLDDCFKKGRDGQEGNQECLASERVCINETGGENVYETYYIYIKSVNGDCTKGRDLKGLSGILKEDARRYGEESCVKSMECFYHQKGDFNIFFNYNMGFSLEDGVQKYSRKVVDQNGSAKEVYVLKRGRDNWYFENDFNKSSALNFIKKWDRMKKIFKGKDFLKEAKKKKKKKAGCC